MSDDATVQIEGPRSGRIGRHYIELPEELDGMIVNGVEEHDGRFWATSDLVWVELKEWR